jgi:hypothetical protein
MQKKFGIFSKDLNENSTQQKLVASGRDCAPLKCVVLYLSLSRWTVRRFLFARLPQAKRWWQALGSSK